MFNLQYDFARFIPLESKVPNAWYQVVTGGKTKELLSYCSNLSHHATASLHVKFYSKVVACCRRTPRTGYEGGKKHSFTFQLIIQELLAKQFTMFCSSTDGNFTTSSPVRYSLKPGKSVLGTRLVTLLRLLCNFQVRYGRGKCSWAACDFPMWWGDYPW